MDKIKPAEQLRKTQIKFGFAEKIEVLATSRQAVVHAAHVFFPKDQNAVSSLNQSFTSLAEFISSRPGEIKTPKIIKPGNIMDLSSKELLHYLKSLNMTGNEIGNVFQGWLSNKFIDVSNLKLSGVSLDPTDNFPQRRKSKKVVAILQEIRSVDWDNFENFYAIAPAYFREIKNAGVEMLRTIRERADRELNGNKIVWSRIVDEIASKERSLLYPIKKEAEPTERTKAEMYFQALKENTEYLKYSFSKDLGKLSPAIEYFISFLGVARNKISEIVPILASSHTLAEFFWALRVRRLIDFSKFPHLKESLIKRYFQANLDQSLQTEAAGFWFEKDLILPRFILKRDEALINSILSLIEVHKQTYSRTIALKPLRFSILINDQKTIKIEVDPTKDDAAAILLKIRGSKNSLSSIDPKERYDLKAESYRYGRKSKRYQEVFSHQRKKKLFGMETPFIAKDPGDYMIRLATTENRRDKVDPENLFMVDSHKALLNIDLTNNQSVNFSIKFAHRFFDGQPAKEIFIKYIQELIRKTHPKQDQSLFMTESSSSKEVTDTSFPFFEAMASSKLDEQLVEPIKKGSTKITPTFLQAAGFALANKVDHFHILVAAQTTPYADGPYDNVQPVIVSFLPIKNIYEKFKNNELITTEEKNKVTEWLKKVQNAQELGKKGLSTAAVLAAPTGTFEGPLSKFAEIFHKAVELLKNSQGMFSPLPNLRPGNHLDNIIFHTAKSDTYALKVTLENPIPSMGIVGYSQSQLDHLSVADFESSFSVRKCPSQCQRSFSNWMNAYVTAHIKKDRQKNRIYKRFNHLVEGWDRLILGKISYKNYQAILEGVFSSMKASLTDAEFKRLGMKNPFDFQRTLNKVMIEDARGTVNIKQISSETTMFFNFISSVVNQ